MPTTNVLSYSDLLAQYKRLAKTANERLRYLEKTGHTKGSAYRSGMKMAKSMGTGGKYFTRSNPNNMRVLRSRMREVEKFLGFETSKVSGIKNVYKKICATIQKEYGLSLTPEQLEDVFESAVWDKLDSQFGSKTAVRVMASIQRTNGDITRTLKSIAAKRLGLTPRERDIVRDTVNEFVTPDDSELKEIKGFFKG